MPPMCFLGHNPNCQELLKFSFKFSCCHLDTCPPSMPDGAQPTSVLCLRNIFTHEELRLWSSLPQEAQPLSLLNVHFPGLLLCEVSTDPSPS